MIFLSGAAHAALKYTVSYDNVSYSIEQSSTEIIYRDTFQTHKIKNIPCSSKVFTKFAKDFLRLKKATSALPDKEKTKYDVRLFQGVTEYSIARGSSFGSWLRKVPSKINYIAGEAFMRCAR